MKFMSASAPLLPIHPERSEYWEHRYQVGDTRWDKGEPAPGLVDFLQTHPELPKGRVLVPGCGTGHDLLPWARAGFDVTGLDFAPSAVARAQQRLQQAGCSGQVLCLNFLRANPVQLFDWVFEHTLYCAIRPDDRSLYFQAVLRWLKPHGYFLAIHYLIPNDGPEPPYGTTVEEVLSRFQPHFELIQHWIPRSYPNRAGLERMFWWRRRN
ncbi:MAG: methyltransferase domain-containing protein [Verrucomicrobiota bacterium]|nr:TPMT family class I SAM-dependent methyltransferase [Limisphaera sp.]MDW8382391.1 methyltransferase domain-containing protein [Verrucomicrobiota bacterium]